MKRKIKVGVMYSENKGVSPINKKIKKGWPTFPMYDGSNIFYSKLLEEDFDLYNLSWKGIDRNLNVEEFYNLSTGEKITKENLNSLDILCFMGFGKVSETRGKQKEMIKKLEEIHNNIKIPTINPTNIVLERIKNKKRYLLDLNKRGISSPNTRLIQSLDDLDNSLNYFTKEYDYCVIKPINGFGGYGIEKFPGGDINLVKKLLKDDSELLIQEFIPNIIETGERSLFLFNEEVKYTILKKSKDFITNVTSNIKNKQNRRIIDCTNEEEKLAKKAIRAITPNSLVARVDLIGNRDSPLVGEITISSIGLNTYLFKDKENIPVICYIDLIKKLVN